jgi:hypothetical protein
VDTWLEGVTDPFLPLRLAVSALITGMERSDRFTEALTHAYSTSYAVAIDRAQTVHNQTRGIQAGGRLPICDGICSPPSTCSTAVRPRSPWCKRAPGDGPHSRFWPTLTLASFTDQLDRTEFDDHRDSA